MAASEKGGNVVVAAAKAQKRGGGKTRFRSTSPPMNVCAWRHAGLTPEQLYDRR
jgi:hypothetical protein